MSKIKKILLISSIPVFVLVLSGCGPDNTKSQQTGPTPTPKQQAQEQITPETKTTPTPAANLEPLPADNKAAVDAEITNIDKELQETENALNSADLSDANLGL